MTVKVVILNASPRPSGIIARACAVATETARNAGAETTTAELYRMTYASCTGCMRCRTTEHCSLPHDAAHDMCEAIREADLLIVGTPTYWGGMAARLKQLFERLVPLFMGLSRHGLPQPRLKGRRALVITACTTPWPFNILFGQSRGAVREDRKVLGAGGMKIARMEIAGTKPMNGVLPETAVRRITRQVAAALRKTEAAR